MEDLLFDGSSYSADDPRLLRLLETQRKLRTNKTKNITFSKPLLWQLDNPVFFPNTINVIQGKAGVHKSRLAETVCAALLRRPESKIDLLNFHSNVSDQIAICYVDTERNLSDQLPYSLQQIQLKAGYDISDHPYGYDYISLLEFPREERFIMLNIYLEHLRKQFPIHLFIILDVITDCVFNFNDTKDSMKLIDLMNQAINRYNVTFLCLIHENPGNTDKARGHLGTEILNKASTVLQIAFEQNPDLEDNNLLRVSFLKCRNSKKHSPFFVQYSDNAKGLIMAPLSEGSSKLDKNYKVSLSQITEALAQHVQGEITRADLFNILMDEFDCSIRTVQKRIKSIIDQKLTVRQNEANHTLCQSQKLKVQMFSLIPCK